MAEPDDTAEGAFRDTIGRARALVDECIEELSELMDIGNIAQVVKLLEVCDELLIEEEGAPEETAPEGPPELIIELQEKPQ